MKRSCLMKDVVKLGISVATTQGISDGVLVSGDVKGA